MSMINSHVPVMLDQVKSFIPTSRDLNLIDATFGGGGDCPMMMYDTTVPRTSLNRFILWKIGPLSQIGKTFASCW